MRAGARTLAMGQVLARCGRGKPTGTRACTRPVVKAVPVILVNGGVCGVS